MTAIFGPRLQSYSLYLHPETLTVEMLSQVGIGRPEQILPPFLPESEPAGRFGAGENLHHGSMAPPPLLVQPRSPAFGSGFTLEGTDELRSDPSAIEPARLR